ncbi:hypothetical protein BOTBODRAFT_179298 [Botryobasidium botryosum FD-172 SS1]|uniref:Malate dehydrogenase n=1 Tax=Botryobasidium botryosum (strain FD-172 SS1) TaxID=930990 RepID=A0A067MBZ7_BOTB1|nr:hypothetical protein BOTBODRAFT_179298 [Botryobasidium botryosum FD-172 SS1]
MSRNRYAYLPELSDIRVLEAVPRTTAMNASTIKRPRCSSRPLSALSFLSHILRFSFFVSLFHYDIMISLMNLLSTVLSIVSVSQLVGASPMPKQSGCSTHDSVLALSPDQTQLVIPPGEFPEFITLGAGVQNYTCDPTTSLYKSTGARAALYDISCAFGSPKFNTLTATVHAALPDDISLVLAELADPPTEGLLGLHYFVPTESGISAKFDFSSVSRTDDPNAFIIGSKVGDIPAPTGSAQDVDWLELTNIQGDLARTVFRVETKGGQPPASCSPGSPDISVKYAAQYWFFK